MKICVIIPIYNEADNIEHVVLRVKAKDLSVIVVDDGSNDNSGSMAADKGAIILREEIRHGKGYALRKGFDYAVKNNYDGVIAMDGDGQHDADDIPGFIEIAKKNNACIITGNRFKDAKAMPFVRYITNRAMSYIVSKACGITIPDTQCGFRYISCSVLKDISLEYDNYEIESELLIKAAKRNIKIYDVPVKTIYNNEKSHIRPVRDTLKFIAFYIKAVFSK